MLIIIVSVSTARISEERPARSDTILIDWGYGFASTITLNWKQFHQAEYFLPMTKEGPREARKLQRRERLIRERRIGDTRANKQTG
jgi:hypothetical protein